MTSVEATQLKHAVSVQEDIMLLVLAITREKRRRSKLCNNRTYTASSYGGLMVIIGRQTSTKECSLPLLLPAFVFAADCLDAGRVDDSG